MTVMQSLVAAVRGHELDVAAKKHVALVAALGSSVVWFAVSRNPYVFFWTLAMCTMNALYTDLRQEPVWRRAVYSLLIGGITYGLVCLTAVLRT